MKRKELLIKVYNEPLIQEILKNKIMTTEQFVEFMVLEGVLDTLDARDRGDRGAKEAAATLKPLQPYLKNGVKNLKQLLQVTKALDLSNPEPGSIRLDDTKFIDSAEKVIIKTKRNIAFDPKSKYAKTTNPELTGAIKTLVRTWPELKDLKPKLIKPLDLAQIASMGKTEVSHKFSYVKPALAMGLSLAAKMKKEIYRLDDVLNVSKESGKRVPQGNEQQKGIEDVLYQIDEIDKFLDNYLTFDSETGDIDDLKNNDSDPVDFIRAVKQETLDSLPSETKQQLDLVWSNLIKSGTIDDKFTGVKLGQFDLTSDALYDIYQFLDKINANKLKLVQINKKLGLGVGKMEKTTSITSGIIPSLDDIDKVDFKSFLSFRETETTPDEEEEAP